MSTIFAIYITFMMRKFIRIVICFNHWILFNKYTSSYIMAQEYPSSPNPWDEFLSPQSKLNNSSFYKILTSPHALGLLPDNFNQLADKTFQQSHMYKFVAFCEKIDNLRNELFRLKHHFHHLKALRELSTLISKEKLNEYTNSLDALTSLLSNLSNKKDLINSIISIDIVDSDFSLHPSIHASLQGLLTDIEKSVPTINSFQKDLSHIQTLSSDGSILTDLREITSYLDECLNNYNSTYTNITTLNRLV